MEGGLYASASIKRRSTVKEVAMLNRVEFYIKLSNGSYQLERPYRNVVLCIQTRIFLPLVRFSISRRSSSRFLLVSTSSPAMRSS